MNLEQERTNRPLTLRTPGSSSASWRRMRVHGLRVAALLVVLLLLSATSPSTQQTRNGVLAQSVAGYGFNLLTWELQALGAKLASALDPPAAGFDGEAGAQLVRDYLDRAQQIAALERESSRLLSEEGAAAAPALAALQPELDALRAQQSADRAQVEQIIEWQVRDELARAGLTLGGRVFPPVQFTFTEPPKKLVVSPRDSIEQVYYRMLRPEIGLETIEAAEATIYDEADLSAYVTRIGGLGAYPAMVVDRGSLPWVLSTVAHEWVHNYLTLAPLGIRYNISQDLTIMNETVAEIVGDEIGARVLQRHYPELVPPDEEAEADASDGAGVSSELLLPTGELTARQPFDFDREMRITRLEVDRLLAEGKVAEAEAYMETRRQFFVENDHPLRVLNQAYFAFHGAYGTSPASTDPIGPKLFQLRELAGDVTAFLRTVRAFTSAEDLEAALATWREE